ncbi:DEAD/DEAH box helicase family protein [Candidatus Berkiella aquae]|uniref:DEAD/DEAH box helicase family protein n=1 Tax=Candidatus Berkiella aquae TaxID=295108 RepID=A0A0Q9YLM0_9GAMM|nr:DEAD/DEAH box helicase family protein [Candidatus Berkiella aquae]MCS5711550.1 DEAD/DEAH box helicase family protein [Candidatus Berkiella aquae]
MKFGPPSLSVEQVLDNVTPFEMNADVSLLYLLINVLKGKVPASVLLQINADALNWNISAKKGEYKNQTALYLLLSAASRGKEEAFTVLAKVAENKAVNWDVPLEHVKNAGLTPLHLLMKLVQQRKPQALIVLNKLVARHGLNWNALAGNGSHGQTPFYMFMKAVYAGIPQIIAVFEHVVANNFINWNAKIIEEGEKGITPLLLLLRTAIKGDQKALAVLAKLGENKDINWSAQAENAQGERITPLHLLLLLVLQEKPQALAVLDKIVTRHGLDWNAPVKTVGESNGITAFYMFMKAVHAEIPEVTVLLDHVVANNELNWDAQVLSGKEEGLTPLHLLMLLVQKQKPLALAVLDKVVARHRLNWNASIKVAGNDSNGKTPFYLFMKAVHAGIPQATAVFDRVVANNELNWDTPVLEGEEKDLTPLHWLLLPTGYQNIPVNKQPIILEGGIAPKYQPAGVLPHLPQYERQHAFEQYQYNSQQVFTPLPFSLMPENLFRDAFQINEQEIQATLYSVDGKLDNSRPVFFIFAGRKEAALLPKANDCRCILVLTQTEYEEITRNQIPLEIDMLVVHRLSSPTHGEFNQLHLLTARRLAAFLVAHHFQLNHFAALDDNIESISFQAVSPSANMKAFYDLLVSQLESKGCISVSTASKTRKLREHELGSKFFVFNMALIREYLLELKDVFLLQPPASEANKPLEDAYFQTFLSVMLNGRSRGYEMQPKNLCVLQRSLQHRNACAKTGMKASIFVGPESLTELAPHQQEWLQEALLVINDYITKKIKRYEEKAKQLEVVDLGVQHGLVHHVEPLQNDSSPSQCRQGQFVSAYQTRLKNWQDKKSILRHYQVSAIQAIANQTEPACSILNATGCGKSMILYTLSQEAFAVLNQGELIAVVTPHIDLSNQMYDDFKEYHGKFESDYPLERIISVSSDSQSCSIRLLNYNHSLEENKHILIFCLDSFQKFCEIPENRAKVRLALYDEFHSYAKSLSVLLQDQPTDSLVVGCTATLPAYKVLHNPVYSYPFTQAITDGYLAPIIADGLGMDFSKENVAKLIQFLPTLLQHQQHPGFGKKTALATTKGIIYLPSIADCDAAEKMMAAANIPCMVVHCKSENRKQNIKQFLQQESGFILAVEMLRFGFNDVNLGVVIIAQNLNNPNNRNHVNLLQQMMGRPLRKLGDKIAYVLTFDDNKVVIDHLLKETPHVNIPTNDYLSQSNTYYLDVKGECKVVDSDDDLVTNINPLFTIEVSSDYFYRRKLLPTDSILQENDDKEQMRDDDGLCDEDEEQLFKRYCKPWSIGMKRKRESISVDTAKQETPMQQGKLARYRCS